MSGKVNKRMRKASKILYGSERYAKGIVKAWDNTPEPGKKIITKQMADAIKENERQQLEAAVRRSIVGVKRPRRF